MDIKQKKYYCVNVVDACSSIFEFLYIGSPGRNGEGRKFDES